MKLVIQRVSSAEITLKSDNSIVNQIGEGLLCLVGVSSQDAWADIEYCANKILKIKLWSETEEKRWQTTVVENNLEVFLISQFTLMANLKKGNKPDFHGAMLPEAAHVKFQSLVDLCRKMYKEDKVKTGKFQNYCSVKLDNDGPVTLIVDSSEVSLDRTQKEGKTQSFDNKSKNANSENQAKKGSKFNKENKKNKNKISDNTTITSDDSKVESQTSNNTDQSSYSPIENPNENSQDNDKRIETLENGSENLA